MGYQYCNTISSFSSFSNVCFTIAWKSFVFHLIRLVYEEAIRLILFFIHTLSNVCAGSGGKTYVYWAAMPQRYFVKSHPSDG